MKSYLIILFILSINAINCETNNNDFTLINVMDDSIGRTDYLMTLYSTVTNKPCLYFSPARFSQPESSLINCTWYKSNACCKRTEVASVFLSMFTLNRASQQCMNLMNFMMCYFCSPDQYIWYRDLKVSICAHFCDDIYENCKNAEYGGRTIGDYYRNGKQFCIAQDFQVIESNHQCFDFDSSPFSVSNRFKAFKLGIITTPLFVKLVTSNLLL